MVHRWREFINNLYGPFTIEGFAHKLNGEIKKFNSKYYCQSASHVDLFIVNWIGEEKWLCPRFFILAR